jgi:TonB family protein
MSLSARRAAAAVLAALLSSIQSPADGQSSPATSPPQVWQVDWEHNFCTISTGDLARAGVALWMMPGDPRPDVFFIGSAKIVPAADIIDELRVTLLPGGESFSAVAMDMSPGSGRRALRLSKLNEAFPAAFAHSSQIRLEGMKEPIAITGSAKAMAALRQCIDEKLPQWGVDAKAYDALRMPATAEHSWITRYDYPRDALAAGAEGDVVARIDVASTGNVTNCTVVVSSGTKALDAATCSSALSKGRFNPAIGADGRPVASQRVVRVTWGIMPSD